MSISRKVAFPLIKDEDDYPPFPVELMWATSTDVPLEFVLDNIPLFATQATLGDKVRVREEDGRLVFEEVVGRSRNSLIRVVVYDGNRIDEVRSELKRLGCASESLATGSSP